MSSDKSGIEIAGRLVGENHHRIVHERAGNGDPLLLAAREFLGKRVHPVLQADPLQHLKRLALLGRRRRAKHARHERHVFEHRLARNELEILKNETDAAAVRLHLPRGEAGEIAAGHADGAVARQAFAQQQPQERRFARAARAGEKDELSFFDANREIAQRVHAAAVEL